MQPPSGGRALRWSGRQVTALFTSRCSRQPSLYQGSVFENFEVTLDFGLTGFSFPVVCV